MRLEYKDDKGNILHGFSVADMEQYNKRLAYQSKWLKALVILGWAGFGYLLIMTYYLIHFNVINNVLAVIGGC